jgi:hypothetical protein
MWLMPLHWRWMIFDLIGLVWDINSEQFAGIVYSNLLNLIFLETLAFSLSVFPFCHSISSLILNVD